MAPIKVWLLLAVKIFVEAFREAMDDDFNTPNALSVPFEMAREINKLKTEDTEKANGLAARLRELAGILGLLQQDPEKFLQAGSDDDEVAKLKRSSNNATKRVLLKIGLLQMRLVMNSLQWELWLEDGPNGTTWRKQ